MNIYFVMLLVMTLLGSAASLFLKKASSSGSIRELLGDLNLYIGGMLYFLSALLNIYILRYLDYSVVLPLTAITYIWTMFLSFWALHENITIKKIIGVAMIILGAVCVSR